MLAAERLAVARGAGASHAQELPDSHDTQNTQQCATRPKASRSAAVLYCTDAVSAVSTRMPQECPPDLGNAAADQSWRREKHGTQ